MPAPKAKLHHLLALVLAARGELSKDNLPDPDNANKLFPWSKTYNMYLESIEWLIDNSYLSKDENGTISLSDKGIVGLELVLTYFHRVNTNILNEQALEMSMEAMRNMSDMVTETSPDRFSKIKDKDKKKILEDLK